MEVLIKNLLTALLNVLGGFVTRSQIVQCTECSLKYAVLCHVTLILPVDVVNSNSIIHII